MTSPIRWRSRPSAPASSLERPARSRGPSTFQRIEAFTGPVTKIKEVTVPVTVEVTDTAVVSVVSRHPKRDSRRIWPPVVAPAA